MMVVGALVACARQKAHAMPYLDTATSGTTAREPARNQGQRLTARCRRGCHHAAACKLLQHSCELYELQGWANVWQIYSGKVQICVTRGDWYYAD